MLVSSGLSKKRALVSKGDNARSDAALRIARQTMFLVPPENVEFDASDFDTKSKLDYIANALLVFIDANELPNGDSQVTIQARDNDSLAAATNEFRQLIYRKVDRASWKPNVLVFVTVEGSNDFRAALQPVHADTMRAVATSNSSMPTTSGALLGLVEEYKAKLTKVLDDKMPALANDPNKLTMRVNFGKLKLTQWNKSKLELTLGELEDAFRVAGSRETAQFLCRVEGHAIEELRARLATANCDLPKVVQEYFDPDVKPELSLILVTNNLEIEAIMEPFETRKQFAYRKLATKSGAPSRVKRFAVSTLYTHQRDRAQKVMHVISSSPHSQYDWEISVEKAVSREEANVPCPFRPTALERAITFADDILDGGFPNLDLAPSFIRDYLVTKVLGKSKWVFPLNIKYSIEIIIYQDWGMNTSNHPTMIATVSLLSPDWDDAMVIPASLPRDWKESFSAQFLQPYSVDGLPEDQDTTAAQHPLDNFLSWVLWVQKTLESYSEPTPQPQRL
ncbi:hypothetical protein QBC35DRAFT_474024 [Podospora australis]|uniref:DUF7905 domain-containing protein n=1 Tax=Podospora australis TaxID=1536484 RepID=A0AAN6WXL5_9PEZI|nr:hypothetical protein QBC35DRAFT_474024 [Podospora australis]